MRKKEYDTEAVLYRIGLAAALVAAAGCLLWQWLPEGLHLWWQQFSFCVLYETTGFLCPGCGGTRAWTALLQGQWLKSFLYHPLVIYGAGWYVCFMGSHTGAFIYRTLCRMHRDDTDRDQNGDRRRWFVSGMKWKNGYLTVALLLLVGNFIIKNLIHLITGVDVLAWLGQQFGS